MGLEKRLLGLKNAAPAHRQQGLYCVMGLEKRPLELKREAVERLYRAACRLSWVLKKDPLIELKLRTMERMATEVESWVLEKDPLN